MMTELEVVALARCQACVRKIFAGATLRTDGYMYWVENRATATSAVAMATEIISRRTTTPERAWRSALEFAAAR